MSLLEGFYGVLGGETNAIWRTGLASIAQAIANKEYEAPPHNQVVGDAGWTPDALSIFFKREKPLIAGTQEFYRESSTTHHRLSQDLPHYSGPPCMKTTLPLSFSVYFTVDEPGKPRPGPFTPPTVSVSYWYTGGTRHDPALDYSQKDTNARYGGVFSRLGDSLKDPYGLTFTENGIFHMNFTMEDPDSKTPPVVYTDQIPVEAVRPCDAPTPDKKTQIANASPAAGGSAAPGGNVPGGSEGEEV